MTTLKPLTLELNDAERRQLWLLSLAAKTALHNAMEGRRGARIGAAYDLTFDDVVELYEFAANLEVAAQ